jgi:ribosome-associated translation inhibitor RaiA
MTIPVQIVYRDFERTDAVDAYIRKHLDKLGGTHAGHVVSCRVALEAPHRHKQHGRHYRVRIDMTVPGAELVVDRSPDEGRLHEDAYAAIDDAFDHALRRVVEHVRRARELAR